MHIHTYIHIYMYTYIYVYIYICIERERERERERDAYRSIVYQIRITHSCIFGQYLPRTLYPYHNYIYT